MRCKLQYINQRYNTSINSASSSLYFTFLKPFQYNYMDLASAFMKFKADVCVKQSNVWNIEKHLKQSLKVGLGSCVSGHL